MDWFRLYGEFATDPKVQMMSEAFQRRYIMLMCMQCSNAIATLHATERDSAVAFQLRISEQEWADTKAVFIAKGFINEACELLNWSKRQYVSDSSTERSRRCREAKKDQLKKDETLQQRSSNALEQNRTEQIQNRTTTSGLQPDGADEQGSHAVEERLKKYRFSPEDEKAATWIRDQLLAANPSMKTPKNLQAWSNDVRLTVEVDGRTHREVCELFAWAAKDSFWSANILSPSKLREKWDVLNAQRRRLTSGSERVDKPSLNQDFSQKNYGQQRPL